MNSERRIRSLQVHVIQTCNEERNINLNLEVRKPNDKQYTTKKPISFNFKIFQQKKETENIYFHLPLVYNLAPGGTGE